MSDKFGLKIGIEGEKEYRKAISQINSDLKVLASEMVKVTTEFSNILYFELIVKYWNYKINQKMVKSTYSL